ncbi:hypothetical protein [Ktedonobacter robiniae]|uniref:DUF4131 domain-containing protein n=1 Tax=Ktedonobacter robiniae TaxID=2778365 RepID=A0ABQ3V6V8_9CHLR|nr:hypothetical protein [Ktedonobacter robiniae]GHO60986.1 hypothetical protein KSB_94610 [Ktedonobacter robiniae]
MNPLLFLIAFLGAFTGEWLLLGLWIAGLFLLASGIAEIGHFSLEFILFSEGLAFLASILTLVWWFRRSRPNTHTTSVAPTITSSTPPVSAQKVPVCLRASAAPAVLHLNTPYNSGNITITVHEYKKRRAFRPMLNRFEAGWKEQGQPKTWFVELQCTIRNNSTDQVYIWGQLEEIVPDDVMPHPPHKLRQFPPINADDSNDIVPGSADLTHIKHRFEVKDLIETNVFFKLNESMNLQMMAFSLYVSSTQSGVYSEYPPLFSIDVS